MRSCSGLATFGGRPTCFGSSSFSAPSRAAARILRNAVSPMLSFAHASAIVSLPAIVSSTTSSRDLACVDPSNDSTSFGPDGGRPPGMALPPSRDAIPVRPLAARRRAGTAA